MSSPAASAEAANDRPLRVSAGYYRWALWCMNYFRIENGSMP